MSRSVPLSRVVHSFLESTSSTLGFHTLGVGEKGREALFVFDFRSVDLTLSSNSLHKVLREIGVGARAGFHILHNATGSETVVDHIERKRYANHGGKGEGNLGEDILTHADSLVSHSDSSF